jgi:pimeloyl-ACP methyl ester carboxylesterase
MTLRALVFAFASLALTASTAWAYPVSFGDQFTTRIVNVNGAAISVTIGGRGPAVVLLHGYAEDSRMWKPLAVALASSYTVIVPDLPGIGNSSIPDAGIDMTTSAQRIREAVRTMGYSKVSVVGHDIGLMVAYAYAAMYPSEVRSLVLMDAFLPGVSGWQAIYNDPGEWHFRFYGPTPVALVQGRERLYFEHFWNDFAAHSDRSLSKADREEYAAAYARPGRMAAGFAYFASFPTTAQAFEKLAQRKLSMPVLSIGGSQSLGQQLGDQTRLVANDASIVIIKDAGHWLMEEQPKQTIAAISSFLARH